VTDGTPGTGGLGKSHRQVLIHGRPSPGALGETGVFYVVSMKKALSEAALNHFFHPLN
jgi:hypothetical protein